MSKIYEFLDSKTLFDRFDKIRKEHGLSFYAIAKNGGFSCEALYKWRDRLSSPSLYLLESICYALNIKLIDLLYDNAIVLTPEEKKIYDSIKTLDMSKKEKLIELIKTLLDE